jgi:hypothetical protein
MRPCGAANALSDHSSWNWSCWQWRYRLATSLSVKFESHCTSMSFPSISSTTSFS